VFKSYLGSSVKMRESHRDHRPLIDLAPSHKLTCQFLDLHAELEKAAERAASVTEAQVRSTDSIQCSDAAEKR
jgi:chromosome partitioning protein